MTDIELNSLQQEVYEHLHNGRFRLALSTAKNLYSVRQDDSGAAIALAWAYLENGEPFKAEQLIRTSSSLEGDSIITRMYRGFLQMRLSNFESAVYDFNMTEGKQRDLLAWTYLNKAKTLALIGDIEKAGNFYNLALLIDNYSKQEWKKLKQFFGKLKSINAITADSIVDEEKEVLDLIDTSLQNKEYWFALFATSKLYQYAANSANKNEIVNQYFEALYKTNQFSLLKQSLEENSGVPDLYTRFSKYLQAIDSFNQSIAESSITIIAPQSNKEKENLTLVENDLIEVTSFKLYDLDTEGESDKKQNLISVNLGSIQSLGVEIIANNCNLAKGDINEDFFFAWYCEDALVHQSTVPIMIRSDWEAVLISSHCDTAQNKLWCLGKARLEIYAKKIKILEYNFEVAQKTIPKEIKLGQTEIAEAPEPEYTVEDAIAELEKIVGLGSVKKAIKELVDYIEVMKERKELGLKSQDKISLHMTYLGNPGTGKTTVARLMGKIFKAMGLIKNGKVIEVDRGLLVGQYVGETAQKTEKIIDDAMGNVLFIDEAYTLVKKGATNDFGQEAIDTLLKKMEDKRGEFIVIAAGYPKPMDDFLSANPGMKSRFTHHFMFEDYSPEELTIIFEKFAEGEDYLITNSAKTLLHKEFVRLYRNRDENFGNARTARKIFEDAKIAVSQYYIALPKYERTQAKLVTITEDNIKAVISPMKETAGFSLPINEEELSLALAELNKLTGLNSVKKDVSEMVKLAKYYLTTGEKLSDKFSSHILFFGNPGTGKTTVARIISKIYSCLGILPQGHLVEVDRQLLVSGFVGQTAQQTKSVIDRAMGGTLFIDEAYTLIKKDNASDFGTEAIDTLLKRMEDDRGKFIVIAAGYTDEMKSFLESNPGLKSRFTKVFNFEDYNPDELMTILLAILAKSKLRISDEANLLASKYFNSIYRNRDKTFGNARVVRNYADLIIRNQNLRLSDSEASGAIVEEKFLIDACDLPNATVSAGETKTAVVGDADTLAKYLDELNSLTGLTEVKTGIERLINSIKMAKLKSSRGIKVIQKPLHTIFTGNPGTGKTTVARLLSKIFKELGVLSKGHLVEVDRAQIVAGYSGQTAIKTDEVFKSALGGTLFIDEAYTLSRGGDAFGQEAIDTLLKRIEDFKEDIVVIVAGYTNEMQQFMSSNPGLTSRFNNQFHFEDYLPEELHTIFMQMSKSNGYKISGDCSEYVLGKFSELYAGRDKNFGNARTVRNLFLDAVTNQEDRLSTSSEVSDVDLATIIKEDIR